MSTLEFSQLLGNYGEFVGSIAVLVTLIILVVQVRTARTEISSQMAREFKRHNCVSSAHTEYRASQHLRPGPG